MPNSSFLNGYGCFSEYYDVLTQNIPYIKRGEYFNAIICENGGKKGGILLDLACGTGSLSEVMAGFGYDVIGVDSSEEMLGRAMEKKYASKHDILYLCQTMEELDLFGTIDCCICALDSLNHLKDSAAVITAMKRVSLFLNQGGIFVFDVNTLYKHEKVLANSTFVYDCDEVYCVWQNSSCKNGKVIISLDLFCKTDEDEAYIRETEQFAEQAYSHEQILSFIKEAGLTLVDYYAEDSKEKPTEDCQRVIYVTKK